MTATRTPVVLADGYAFTECPRWHDDRLYFSDIHGHVVVSLTETGQQEICAQLTDAPAGLGWLPDGRLLVVSGRQILRKEPDGTMSVHADLSKIVDCELNDMWVDERGRAYVGSTGLDLQALLREMAEQFANTADAMPTIMARVAARPGSLFLVEVDGSITELDSQIAFPNGIVLSPDGKSLYVAATFGPSLLTYSVDADGLLSDRQTAMLPFAPDGVSLVDQQGCLWIADPVGKGAARVTTTGSVQERVDTELPCLAAALGGVDGRTLFLCTSGSTDRDQCRAERGARIETVRVDVAASGVGPLVE